MRKKQGFASFSLIGFVLFFLTIAITSTTSIAIYYVANKNSNGNTLIISLSVMGIILVGAIICTAIDIIRRKYMVEKPVNMILDATEQIAKGNFDVQLQPLHEYSKYNQYDEIFENINILSSELKKNEMLKNDFISNVSHEIKTPLAIINNYAKSLMSDSLDKAKRKEIIDGLVSQTMRLSDLVTNILKLNKLENQQLLPEFEKFDLTELLRTCVLQYESLLDKKNLQLDIDMDELSIVNSRSMLEIVFNNLISNAIKFTDNGGKIKVTAKEHNDLVVVSVSDSGRGISNEVGKRIFDKFYQADSSRSSEGNGLGLAIVKKVIDLIGGEILVESKVGVGSTFTVKLQKGDL